MFSRASYLFHRTESPEITPCFRAAQFDIMFHRANSFCGIEISCSCPCNCIFQVNTKFRERSLVLERTKYILLPFRSYVYTAEPKKKKKPSRRSRAVKEPRPLFLSRDASLGGDLRSYFILQCISSKRAASPRLSNDLAIFPRLPSPSRVRKSRLSLPLFPLSRCFLPTFLSERSSLVRIIAKFSGSRASTLIVI